MGLISLRSTAPPHCLLINSLTVSAFAELTDVAVADRWGYV